MALNGRIINIYGRRMTIYILLICGCFLSRNTCAGEMEIVNTETQSRTYADFLNDVSTSIQHAKDPERLDMAEKLSEKLYDLQLPIQKIITRGKRLEKLRKEKGTSLTDMGWENDENIEDFLYSMLDTLQSIGRDGNATITSVCMNDTGRLITSLISGESWATQFLDATGKPGPSLTHYHYFLVGNYEQCKAATAPPIAGEEEKSGYTGNYCGIDLFTGNPMLRVELGACLPSTCSSGEITALMGELVHMAVPKIPASMVYAVCRTAPTKITTATIFAILILAVIGILMLLGTGLDLLIMLRRPKEMVSHLNSHSEQPSNGYERISNHDEVTPLNNESSPLLPSFKQDKAHEDNVSMKILLAFSVISNGKKILNTSQAPGSLGSIHGIRFLSMSWVMLCHWYAFVMGYTVNGIDEMGDMLQRWTFMPIANGFTSVDTFFTLSGLLTSYLTIKEMMRKNTWKINWPMFYFHRFWRLTPPYMFAIVIVLGLTQFMGHGPLWPNMQPGDKPACEKNWWTNLLYINNIVNSKEMCFGHSWYLANDMQFFVLSPLMLIPFYFHKLAGLLSCFVFLLVTWITTGVESTIHDWPTTTVSLKPVPGRAGQLEWFNNYYIVPWCRIGPFIVGIMAGYVLALTKGRQFRLPWWGVTIGWIVSAASGFAVVYGIRGDIVGDNPSTVGAAALYNAVGRTVWGACVSWVIVACSAGYGGPVNRLLSWSPFVTLGRLTYMSYLIHLCIGGVFYQNLGALIYFNDSTMVIMFLGILCFVNMVSFVAVLALESPMLGLEKTFIRKERKE